MEKVTIKVCVRPYFHDVIDTIERKPKFDADKEKHYVRYNNKLYPLVKTVNQYVIWVEDE